jgi:hypothetical protein
VWVLAALAVCAVGAAVWQLRRPGPISNDVWLACAATGETFHLSRERVPVIPGRNPRTGQDTLLPCYFRNGQGFIMQRYRGELARLGEQNTHVDPETLAVRPLD